jgi:ubiquitin-conjugating enzyme E2 D/E
MTQLQQLQLENRPITSEVTRKHTISTNDQSIANKKQKLQNSALPPSLPDKTSPQSQVYLQNNTKFNTISKKRLEKELKDIEIESKKNSDFPYSLGPVDTTNLYHWNAMILGPEIWGGDGISPYAGGVFFIDITIPEDYPFKSPKFKFITRTYHPNIIENRIIELEYLKEWTPEKTLCGTMNKIIDLFAYPDAENSLNPEAAHLYKTNRERFKDIARDWTNKYAL